MAKKRTGVKQTPMGKAYSNIAFGIEILLEGHKQTLCVLFALAEKLGFTFEELTKHADEINDKIYNKVMREMQEEMAREKKDADI